MCHNFSSGNFSSRSFGGFLDNQVHTCGSFYPSNIVFTPSTCHVGSSGENCSQIFREPTHCQTPGIVGRSFQTSFYRPRNFIFRSPYHTNFVGSLGIGNTHLGSFHSGSAGFQSRGFRSGFVHPASFSSRNLQSVYYQPGFGSRFFGSAY